MAIELLYLWNALPQCSKDDLQKIYKGGYFFVFLFIHLAATDVTKQLCAYVQLYAYMQHLSVKKMAPSEVKV